MMGLIILFPYIVFSFFLFLYINKKQLNNSIYFFFFAVYFGAFLILFPLHAVWIFGYYEDSLEYGVQISKAFIDLESFKNALLLMHLSSISFLFGFLVFRKFYLINVDSYYRVSRGWPLIISRMIIIIIVAIVVYKVGLFSLFEKPGQSSVQGLATLLMLLNVPKFYIYASIFTIKKVGKIDSVILSLILLILLLTSRINFLFTFLEVVSILLILNKINVKKSLSYVFFLVLLIFIVFGMYRHYTSISSRFDNDIFQFIAGSASSFLDIINWFFYANIEGFSGFASAIYLDSQGEGSIDFGTSTLLTALKIIPSYIYAIFSIDINSIVVRYTDNIYSSGLPSFFETSFIHFSYIGVPISSFIFGIYIKFIFTSIRKNPILFIVLSLGSINFIRGGFPGGILHILVLLVTYGMYKVIFYNQLRNKYRPD